MTREEAIEILSFYQNSLNNWGADRIAKAFDMAIEALSERTGEWIDVENEPYCKCSVCGSYIDNLDDNYAFCPRCGARMKGGDDE